MAKELHLQFYDQIGADFWGGEGTTAKGVAAHLAANPDAPEIILHINSPGGSVYEGYTIYNLLKTSGKKVTAKIEGYCASIATLIALSAEEIEMMPLAQWLIHNPFTAVEGTAEDLQGAIEELKRIESVLVGVYVSRTGKPEEEIRDLMKEDKFISAEQAVEMGFATRVLEPLKAVAFYNPPKKENPTKTEPEMSTEKKPSAWAKLKAAFAEVTAAFDESEPPVAASQALENGDSFYFDGELQEGTLVFTDEAMTIQPEDGEYTLEDGRVLTVSAGAVQSIAAPAPENNAELEAAQARIAELESQLSEAQNTAAAKDTTISNLKNKLKEVPGAKAKAATPPQAHSNDTEPGTGGKTEQSQAFNNAAEKLKAKYNRK